MDATPVSVRFALLQLSLMAGMLALGTAMVRNDTDLLRGTPTVATAQPIRR